MTEDQKFGLQLAKNRAMKLDEADTPTFKPVTTEPTPRFKPIAPEQAAPLGELVLRITDM